MADTRLAASITKLILSWRRRLKRRQNSITHSMEWVIPLLKRVIKSTPQNAQCPRFLAWRLRLPPPYQYSKSLLMLTPGRT